MRKRLVSAMLLAALFFTVGSTSGLRDHEGAGFGASVAEKLALLPAQPVVQLEAPKLAADRVAEERMGARAKVRRSEPVTLSDDENALVAAMCELQLLAQGTEMELGSEQWKALAAVTLDIQAIRQTYEAEIATATVLAPGHYRVEIPVYAQAGDELRARFHAGLRAALGEIAAADVIAKMGSRLEGHFAGFGVSVQTLDITAEPGRARTDYEVTRTVTYWDSVAGEDRLATRRETHFPGWEDPIGERWDALLATVGA